MIKYPKRKGKRLEEKVARIIRELWNIKEEDRIHRSLTSGIVGIEKGDIKFNLKEKIYIWIECKNREDWDESDLIGFKDKIKSFFVKMLKDINKKQEPYLPVLAVSKAFSSNTYCITIHELFFNETFLNKCNLYLNTQEFEVGNYNFVLYVKVNRENVFRENNILEKYIPKRANSQKLTIMIMEINDFFKLIKPLII